MLGGTTGTGYHSESDSDIEPPFRGFDRNMAEATGTEIMLARDMVPEYHGGSKDLLDFINKGDQFIDLLKKPDVNCVFNKLLLHNIVSKIKGEARDLINNSSYSTWRDLKDILIDSYQKIRVQINKDDIIGHALLLDLGHTVNSIEQELLKFNSIHKRSRRGLVNGLGTIIKYVTGNLDQNDLTTIQNNFHKLHNTQNQIIEQVNTQISFAHAISAKLEETMNVIEKRLLNAQAAIREFKENSDKHMVISRILFVANQLYENVKSLEVSLTLAMQGIPNLGSFSRSELGLIQDHLSKIYTPKALSHNNRVVSETMVETVLSSEITRSQHEEVQVACENDCVRHSLKVSGMLYTSLKYDNASQAHKMWFTDRRIPHQWQSGGSSPHSRYECVMNQFRQLCWLDSNFWKKLSAGSIKKSNAWKV
ncbi:unnamed protein product [Callosobruchus maculatus]|uniref:Uncharacterized protein n=1 Tax=Callosobruchus maculatus TaxID=64391 RepID=A0A653CE16_CALMS|nr:unnamed protein product [Callosobruchus maculatus]